MSFRCANCKKATQPYEPMTRVVIETRQKEYQNKIPVLQDGLRDVPKYEFVNTIGTEIVREVAFCPACAGIKVPVDTDAVKPTKDSVFVTGA